LRIVDFKKLRASKAKPNPVPPREIFHSLSKPAGINDLYASQAEVLDIWHGRRHDRDIVVKLHTGGGKTLVALLMALRRDELCWSRSSAISRTMCACGATIKMRIRIASSVDVPRRGCHCLARMFPVISSECSQKIQLVDPLGR
jgi:hypothetical protein